MRVCPRLRMIFTDLAEYTRARLDSMDTRPRLMKYKIFASGKWINLPLKSNKRIMGWSNDAKYAAQHALGAHISVWCTHPKFRLDEYTDNMFERNAEQLVYWAEIDATGTFKREYISGTVTRCCYDLHPVGAMQ